MSTQTRDAYWDCNRAVLMWLVVLGHSIQLLNPAHFFEHPVFKVIYMFHVPLFMWISGYFALNSIKKSGLKIISRRGTQFLLPIFTLGTLQAIMSVCQGRSDLTHILFSYHCMWFLWSLFECFVFATLMQTLRHPVWKLTTAILPIILSVYTPTYIPYGSYLSFVWPFFILGMYCRHKKLTSEHINLKWLIALPAAIAIFFAYRSNWYMYLSPLSMNLNSAGIWLFRIAAAVCSGAVFLAVMKYLPLKMPAKIGTATLGIYVLQSGFFSVAAKLRIPDELPNTAMMIALSLIIFIGAYFFYKATCKIRIFSLLLYGSRAVE